MKKKMAVLLTIILVLCMIPTQIFGESIQKSDSDIGLRWTSIIDYHNIFEISGSGAATVDVGLYARSDINKVVIDASIQQYVDGNWQTIKSWTSTSYSSNGYISKTWYVNKGYYYRLVSTGKVYQDDVLVEQVFYTGSSYWY